MKYIKIINKRKKSILKLQGVLIALLLLIVIGKTAYKTMPAFRQTVILATTVQPERFTELYFENHLDLPKDALPNKPYTFSFTVHNLEYRDTTYDYESYFDSDNKKTNIASGSFTLKQDRYKTIKQDYSLIKELPRTKIIVNLKNKQNQQIHFWVENTQITITPAIPQKQYGAWYWQPNLNKAQVWLGKDNAGQDIWSDQLPAVKKIQSPKNPISKKWKYGGWYWQPETKKSQVWLGTDKSGKDIWADNFPTPTPTKKPIKK